MRKRRRNLSKTASRSLDVQPRGNLCMVRNVERLRLVGRRRLIARGWWRRGRVELPVQKAPNWNVLQAYPAICFACRSFRRPNLRRRSRLVLGPASSALGQQHPGFMAPASRPPGAARADVAALRQLGRVHDRQLLLCHLFTRCGGASACNSAKHPPVEPARPHRLVDAYIMPHSRRGGLRVRQGNPVWPRPVLDTLLTPALRLPNPPHR